MMNRPTTRPRVPNFSSGPCTKRPGWRLDALSGAALGRSHRSPLGKDKLKEAIDLTLPLAREKKMGVIAKRPIANAAWKSGHKPIDSYQHEYWERLRKLNYDFLGHGDLERTISIALRFTLSVPSVHTAIVGTKKPERWKENAKMLEDGPLSEDEFEAIRNRWEEYAPRIWVGQT